MHLGLLFSDKKIIPRNTEQTTVPSEFRLFRVREKLRNSVPNHFSKAKNPRNSVPNNFSEEKNPGNSIPNHFWMRKTSEFHSKPFSEEKATTVTQLSYNHHPTKLQPSPALSYNRHP
jgi:hypothetical protein